MCVDQVGAIRYVSRMVAKTVSECVCVCVCAANSLPDVCVLDNVTEKGTAAALAGLLAECEPPMSDTDCAWLSVGAHG